MLRDLQAIIQADLEAKGLKFTPAGGLVSVTVTERPGEAGDAAIYEFTIRDTGIGMAPEFLAHIFEPFERERTSTVSGIQGTGLGMSITKNLVELMQGHIAVESRKGHGTTFTLTFSFPLSGAPDGGKPTALPAPNSWPGHGCCW